MTKPELLSPAGDMECLRAALDFGADAVYLGGTRFGMRASPSNFDDAQLEQAVAMAHEKSARIYVACNALPHNNELAELPNFLAFAERIGVDAFIIADLGVLAMTKKYAPNVALHISTQMGVVNWAAAEALYEMGAERVVLARELSLSEITEIRAHTPPKLVLEGFVHGAMCMSFSGRCLLSSYMTGRDANRGDCAQPCRWSYALAEGKRPGQYFPIETAPEGSYILNSNDLCMLEHLPELLAAGITSLKIEGRAKSAYYVAAMTAAYRAALDYCLVHPREPLPAWIVQETEKISHRTYSTGFYFGGEPGQNTQTGGYIRDYEQIAVCVGERDGLTVLSQRNRFFNGDTADILQPGEPPFLCKLEGIMNEAGEPIEAAPHATMTVLCKLSRPLKAGAILRKKRSS